MYDQAFYEAETVIALDSASVVLPNLLKRLNAKTVIDVGCGTGGWVWTAQALGANAIGVDHGVPADQLLPIRYVDCDLTDGYPCTDFDLAICLEVAEHLPESSAVPLVNGLARATTILFSAATPGQPGINHINCRPHEYWHLLFAAHGFTPTHIGPDYLEPVADFYRRNMYLYERQL